MIEIYTDGSARANGTSHSSGGYGVVVLEDGKLIDAYSKQYSNVTNNQMELKAILYAMVKYGKYNPTVYSDSRYAINVYQSWYPAWRANGWVKSDKKVPENLEIIQAYAELEDKGYHINLVKVLGHAGNYWNEIADKLATGKIDAGDVYKMSE